MILDTSAITDDLFGLENLAEVVMQPFLGVRLNPSESIVFDIEAGPLPEDMLATTFEPYPELQPFSEADVKIGNLKDEQKIRDKIALARAEHEVEYERKRQKHFQDQRDKAALSPLTGHVVTIGYKHAGGSGKPETKVIHGTADEQEMLREFWSIVVRCQKQSGKLIGWNIANYDLPFLVRRSWLYDINVPRELAFNGRYLSSLFIDLHEVWRGSTGEFCSLNKVARYFGLPGKIGSGQTFADDWKHDRTKAVMYMTRDLDLTYAVGQRMQML